MLTIENLSVRYGKKTVLKDLNIRIEKEKITVIVGKNGSGKSTLLRCLAGEIPYTGTILLDGKDLQNTSPRERAKKAALMPQILPETALTVKELAFLGRNPYLGTGGKYTQKDREAVQKALMLSQTQDICDRSVNRLSGGEQRRAFLCMLLAQDTPLMALDEPTAHLDADNTARFTACLQQLVREEKKTVLLVSHDLTTAANLADNIICPDGGKLVFAGSKEEFVNNNIAETVFGIKKTFFTDDNGCQRILYYK